MFNIVEDPCRICSHKKVRSMKESYHNFVRKFDGNFKGNAPECVSIEVTCKYQDPDIRVKSW